MNYYADMLAEGRAFEEHVKEVFFKEFAIWLDFTGADNQNRIGETLQGVEVKLDKKFEETGNLYIEVAEKTNENNPDWVKSGVFRDDNTWLYAIGNYDKLYVFSKKHLKRMKDQCKHVITPTSMGFLLPEELAEQEAIKVITRAGETDVGEYKKD